MAKRKLKAALQDFHQQRQQRQRGKPAAVATIKQEGKAQKLKQQQRKFELPHSSNHHILLVGEGNFSFTLALANLLYVHKASTPSTSNASTAEEELLGSDWEEWVEATSTSASRPLGSITATTLDSRAVTLEKYPDAERILDTLETTPSFSTRVHLHFGVDATRLDKFTKHWKRCSFDRIVFNFPHVGLGITDQDRNVLANQKLIAGFLASVCNTGLLGQKDGSRPFHSRNRKHKQNRPQESSSCMRGYQLARPSNSSTSSNTSNIPEIHITTKTGGPYDLWNVKLLAKVESFACRTSFSFDPAQYPGYTHRRTLGYQEGVTPDENAELKNCRTWIFIDAKEMSGRNPQEVLKARKKAKTDEEDGDSE